VIERKGTKWPIIFTGQDKEDVEKKGRERGSIIIPSSCLCLSAKCLIG